MVDRLMVPYLKREPEKEVREVETLKLLKVGQTFDIAGVTYRVVHVNPGKHRASITPVEGKIRLKAGGPVYSQQTAYLDKD